MSASTPLTVSQLNFYVKSLLEGDRNLRSVWLKGELSNFTRVQKSGHCYFSIKDQNAAVKGAMFASSAYRLTFVPKDGMQVLVHGKISLYERDGQYQFYADQMLPDGMGQAYLEFLRLKDQLSAEGLFERKKPLPAYPTVVGVCTSPSGAAIKDFISVCRRLHPGLKIVLYPCLMQGAGTVSSVLEGLEYFRRRGGVDLVVVTRGGGSYEDLAVFNDESLARYAAAYPLPLISAIGHEIDFTILDFAADLRAATPSVAAEMAVGQVPALQEQLYRFRRSLDAAMTVRLRLEKEILDRLRFRADPTRILQDRAQRLDRAAVRLDHAADLYTQRVCSDFSRLTARLHALDPLSVLSRGYAVAEKEGRPVCRAAEIEPGDRLLLTFQDGGIVCAAESKL